MSTSARPGTPTFSPFHLPRFSRPDWALLSRAARTAAGISGWGLLTFFALSTAYFAWWFILALVLLGQGPSSSGPLPIIVPVLALITLALAGAVARFLSSLRRVVIALAAILALVWSIDLVWAFAAPDWALYQARATAWGESDVNDYQKFPQRAIANAAPAFTFPQSPAGIQTHGIEYQSRDGTKLIADLDSFLESTNTTSFIVIKDGQIRYEKYFNGYERDSIVTSFSVAKSYISALVGIAIQEGYIGSVDDKITLYLPELRDKEFDDVTIRHLLTMSSGVRYITNDEQSALQFFTLKSEQTKAYYHPDLRSSALGVEPDGREAGAVFKYNDYLPQLMGVILERTTHRSVSQYLSEKIWQPLGMEYPASWSMDSKDSGFEQMGAGINGRAVDFAKFGQLFLQDGAWLGRQVVPEAWVLESTSPDPNDRRPWDLDDEGWKAAGGYYKYYWWGIPNADATHDYVARGHLGQRIFVSPRDNAVVVRFGINDGGIEEDWDRVIPAIIATMR